MNNVEKRSTDRKDDDVKLVGSRLFVGNLNERITKEVIENRFGKYGRILGVSLHRDHCFIQFEEESCCHLAVKGEHESIMFGSKLDVHVEGDVQRESFREEKTRFGPPLRRRSPSLESRRPRRERPREDSYGRPVYRERSPIMSRGRENFDTYRRDESRPPNRVEDRFRAAEPAVVQNQRDREPFETVGRSRPVVEQPYFNRRPMDSQQQQQQVNSPQYKVRDLYENFVQENVKPPIAISKANDCEIIVMNKIQRAYAELVERKLKAFGMKVDILFPKEDTPILALLSDIGNRGCLYAIVILPQNEVHKSITVNILYGSPQEHRNMPLEDAVSFVSRNFAMYMRDKTTARHPPQVSENLEPMSAVAPLPPAAAAAVAGGGSSFMNSNMSSNLQQQQQQQQQQQLQPPPSAYVKPPPQQQQPPLVGSSMDVVTDAGGDAQTLIRLLAKDKQLTVAELNCVIKYLEEVRDRMVVTTRNKETFAAETAQQQQAELQQKIYNLFGGGPAANNIGSGGGSSNSNMGTSLQPMATSSGSSNNMLATGVSGRDINPSGVVTSSYDNRSRAGDGGGVGVSRRKGGEGRWGPPVASSSSSSLNINLDNPNIQKALDSLLQSSSNILKGFDAPSGGGGGTGSGGQSDYQSKSLQGSVDRRYLGSGMHHSSDLHGLDARGSSGVGGGGLGRESRMLMDVDGRSGGGRDTRVNVDEGRDSRGLDLGSQGIGRDARNLDLEPRYGVRESRNVDHDSRHSSSLYQDSRYLGGSRNVELDDLESSLSSPQHGGMSRDSRGLVASASGGGGGGGQRGVGGGMAIDQDTRSSQDLRNVGIIESTRGLTSAASSLGKRSDLQQQLANNRELDSRALLGLDVHSRDVAPRRMSGQQSIHNSMDLDRYGRGLETMHATSNTRSNLVPEQDLSAMHMSMGSRMVPQDGGGGMGGTSGGYSGQARQFQGQHPAQGPPPYMHHPYY